MFGKKHSSGAGQTIGWILCILLLLSTLAALRGVYVTHFAFGGATFGSSNASLSLIAFAVNIGLFGKCLFCCMGCAEKKK